MSLLCAGVVGAEWGVSETTVVFAGSHVHQFRHGRPRWSRCKMTFYIGSNTVCRYGIGLQTQTISIHPYTRRRLTSSRIGGCPFCVSDAPGASQRRPSQIRVWRFHTPAVHTERARLTRSAPRTLAPTPISRLPARPKNLRAKRTNDLFKMLVTLPALLGATRGSPGGG
jgi:hypothetical protein